MFSNFRMQVSTLHRTVNAWRERLYHILCLGNQKNYIQGGGEFHHAISPVEVKKYFQKGEHMLVSYDLHFNPSNIM